MSKLLKQKKQRFVGAPEAAQSATMSLLQEKETKPETDAFKPESREIDSESLLESQAAG